MESIRISIIQTDIVWENKQENLRLLHENAAKSSWNNGDCCFTGRCFLPDSVCRVKYWQSQIPGNHYNTQTMGQIPASHLRKLYSNRERTVFITVRSF